MMAPWPIAVFVGIFTLMFAFFAIFLGLGMWLVIIRLALSTLRNLSSHGWRDLKDIPAALFWVLLGGFGGALIASGGFMLADHVMRGIISRWA